MLNLFKKIFYYSFLAILKIYFGEVVLSFCQFKFLQTVILKKKLWRVLFFLQISQNLGISFISVVPGV